MLDLDESKAYRMPYCLLEEKNSTLRFATAAVHLKGLYEGMDLRMKQASKVKEFFKT